MPNFKHIFYILSVLSLIGCNEKPHTVDYLLQHPTVLEKELRFCISDDAKSETQMINCKTVMEAQDEIRVYLDAQQSDPEKFGQRILDTEAACAQLESARNAAQQAIVTLSSRDAGAAELQSMRTKLAEAEKRYREKQQELKILLAVMGLSSP